MQTDGGELHTLFGAINIEGYGNDKAASGSYNEGLQQCTSTFLVPRTPTTLQTFLVPQTPSPKSSHIFWLNKIQTKILIDIFFSSRFYSTMEEKNDGKT
jgi:hypothetical protein